MSDPGSEVVAGESVADVGLVRATRMAAGAILLAAAALSAITRSRASREHGGDEETTDAGAGTASGTGAGAAAYAALASTIDAERAVDGLLRAAGRAVTRTAAAATAVRGWVPPLARWVDGWVEGATGRVEALGERGRTDAEAGMEPLENALENAWKRLVDAAVRQALDSIDPDELAGRVDVNALAARIDVDAIVRRVDVEAILRRVDLPGIAQDVLDEIEIDDIIRESSGSLAVQTIDALRERGADADRQLARFVDRLLGRQRERDAGFAAGVRVADDDTSAGGGSAASSPPQDAKAGRT